MFNFRVELEIPQLKFAYVSCPRCTKEFDAMKHGKTKFAGQISDSVDLIFSNYKCPHCSEEFETRGKDFYISES